MFKRIWMEGSGPKNGRGGGVWKPNLIYYSSLSKYVVYVTKDLVKEEAIKEKKHRPP